MFDGETKNLAVLGTWGVDLDNRTLNLFETIDEEVCAEARKWLLYLDSLNQEPITIHLSTNGGCVFSGMGLVDVIRNLDSDVIIVATGPVFSMGAIILQAGTKRLAYPNTAFLVHQGSETLEGTPSDNRQWSKFLDKINGRIIDLFVERSGRSRAYWKRTFNRGEMLYSSEEALKVGIIDEIIGAKNANK